MKSNTNWKKAVEERYSEFADKYFEINKNIILQFQLSEFSSFLPKKGRVLDIGCGFGRDVEYLSEDGFKAFGIDISKEMIRLAKENFNPDLFEVADFTNLKYDSKSYDGVWSCASLIHVPKSEISSVLKKMKFILTDSGVMFLTMIEGSGEKETEIKSFYNGLLPVSFYSRDELEDYIVAAGFKIIRSYSDYDGQFNWIDFIIAKQ